MDVDPSDYSVDELRAVAGEERSEVDTDRERRFGEHGFLWGDPFGHRALGVEAPTPGHCERLLALEGIDPPTLGPEPYLEGIPECGRTDEVVFGWLEFLSKVAGYEGTLEALERYRTLGWIAEAAERDLRGYMLGIDREGTDGPGQERERGQEKGFGALDRADHVVSFAHVAWLAARE